MIKVGSCEWVFGGRIVSLAWNVVCLLTHWPLGDFNLILGPVIFKLILVNGGWGISYQIALRWMPLDLTDDESTLIQVMAWCHQATSHYLSQCWPRSMSPNGITRPQWVNSLRLVMTFGINEQNGQHYAGNIFKRILSHEKFSILIKIILKFVPEGPIDDELTLIQVMSWCLFSAKLLYIPPLTYGWLNP